MGKGDPASLSWRKGWVDFSEGRGYSAENFTLKRMKTKQMNRKEEKNINKRAKR